MKRLISPIIYLVVIAFVLPIVAAQDPASTRPVVSIINAGSGEKKELRYVFQKGDESNFEVMMLVTSESAMGDQVMPTQKLPPIKVSLSTKVLSVGPDGDATCEFAYTGMDVVDDPANPNPMAESLRKSLSVVAGTKGSLVISSRGIVKYFQIQYPDRAEPLAMQQMGVFKNYFSQFCMAFPDEAVGVGATWKIVQDFSSEGIQSGQVITATLKKTQHEAIEVEWQFAQHASEQEQQNPQTPVGDTAHLVSAESNGNGNSSRSLSSIFPSKSTLTIKNVMIQKIERRGDRKTTVNMTMTGQSVEAKPESPKSTP